MDFLNNSADFEKHYRSNAGECPEIFCSPSNSTTVWFDGSESIDQNEASANLTTDEPATYHIGGQERPAVHYLVKVSRAAKVFYGFSRSILRRLTQFYSKTIQTIFLARKQVNLQSGYLESLDCSCRTVRDHPAPPVSESTVGWIFPTYPTNSIMAKRRTTVSTPIWELEVIARRFALFI